MIGAGGWRLALRIGRREAWRAKWRSLLIVAMIALPVAGVTAVAVTYKTYDVNTAEGLDRRLGTEAAARVEVQSPGAVRQGIDPEKAASWLEPDSADKPLDEAGLRAAVGDRPVLEADDYGLDVRTDKGATGATGLRTDLTDPLAAGLVRLTDGRLPQASDEVVVNAALAARGPSIGDELEIRTGESREVRKVVGIAESTTVRNDAFVAGAGLPRGESAIPAWLVGGGAFTWADVEKLNASGAFVLSRSVVQNPPAAARAADRELQPRMEAPDPADAVVVVLIVVMALLEVVLLAGPAFAVAARRQARDLALIAASGGTAHQSRRVVLGSAVVIGAVAAAAGALLGVGVARLLQPLAQDQVSAWFGPFEVPWLQVLAVACTGFAAAICAALVPAWVASRQNAVGVLSGRRSASRPSRRSPVIGVVLLAAGVASAAFGTQNAFSGLPIALGVLLCVTGLLFILPVLISVAARLSARMPLVVRFATRDADRHRTRTVPAVGAIAVTVVGVITLGIAFGSDEEQNQKTYQPSIAIGDAVVQPRFGGAEAGDAPSAARWETTRAQVEKAVPGSTVTPMSGAVFGEDGSYFSVETADRGQVALDNGGGFGELTVVGDDGKLPPAVTRSLVGVDVDAAEKTLRSSGVVVFTTDDSLVTSRSARLVVREFSEEDDQEHERVGIEAPATYVDVGDRVAPSYAVVTEATARRLGADPQVIGLYVEDARISAAAETDLDEALAAGDISSTLEVERGFQSDDYTVIVWLLLVTLGAVLMIGGALTATHLALNDARPDLATLSAVGARTRTRRGVAAAYAIVVTLLGAVPGAIIGLVPGIAVTYPLTAEGWPARDDVASHYLVIPWGLIGLIVVGLPLLAALIVVATTRSRLPMVARVE
ncbi:putative ABC transport system permease protein [Nocardioides albertanoniae]|uniref:Putative ABC transport system permease protein n=1 Tax=Nocardioides albertanoniae TaxID=1175486 RepID=A0A543ADX4_9ACTN|nr:ABC transporter permease [Nocardioides albertanoniae]TQL70783.1 putative ABC transport system permease protein [Nocardioides albertanoniae]